MFQIGVTLTRVGTNLWALWSSAPLWLNFDPSFWLPNGGIPLKRSLIQAIPTNVIPRLQKIPKGDSSIKIINQKPTQKKAHRQPILPPSQYSWPNSLTLIISQPKSSATRIWIHDMKHTHNFCVNWIYGRQLTWNTKKSIWISYLNLSKIQTSTRPGGWRLNTTFGFFSFSLHL